MFKKYQKYILIALIILILLIGGFFSYKFIFSNFGKSETEIALEKYFDAKAKSGTFTYEKPGQDETGKFWVDGEKFKIEFTQEDGYHRWLLSPDGENVYYCYDEDEGCIVGVVPVKNYMLRWYKPSEDTESLGMDEEYDCEKIKYTVDTTYDMEGAGNKYYVGSVLYCVADGDLIYREHAGYVPSDDGENELNVSRFYIDEVDLKPDFSDVSFERMYDMRED